jgi:hypothetical protein
MLTGSTVLADTCRPRSDSGPSVATPYRSGYYRYRSGYQGVAESPVYYPGAAWTYGSVRYGSPARSMYQFEEYRRSLGKP